MSVESEKNHVVDLLMENAIQLLVADRLKAPKDVARVPLTKEQAVAYVVDVATMFSAAHIMVNTQAKTP
jgi:hypothetical protein